MLIDYIRNKSPKPSISSFILIQENTSMKNQIKDLRLMKNLTNSQLIWGSFFLTFGVVSFLGFLYCAVISKLLPPSHNPLIFAIQRDRYYCFLVPLSLPILVVAVYFHWLSMKLFKHA